jgi:flotillin
MVDVNLVIVVSVLVLAMLSQLLVFAWRYKKVPPDRAMVVYGRMMHPGSRTGHRFISGGGKFLLPIVEEMKEMDVGVKALSKELDNVKTDPEHGSSKMRVNLICLYKAATEPSALRVGVEHLMGKSQEDIKRMVEVCLEGAIRTIAYGMSPREIDLGREDLALKVRQGAGAELLNIGIEVTSLAIVDLRERGV